VRVEAGDVRAVSGSTASCSPPEAIWQIWTSCASGHDDPGSCDGNMDVGRPCCNRWSTPAAHRGGPPGGRPSARRHQCWPATGVGGTPTVRPPGDPHVNIGWGRSRRLLGWPAAMGLWGTQKRSIPPATAIRPRRAYRSVSVTDLSTRPTMPCGRPGAGRRIATSRRGVRARNGHPPMANVMRPGRRRWSNCIRAGVDSRCPRPAGGR